MANFLLAVPARAQHWQVVSHPRATMRFCLSSFQRSSYGGKQMNCINGRSGMTSCEWILYEGGVNCIYIALESCFFLLFFASTRRSADHPMALHRRSIWYFCPFSAFPLQANSPIFASKCLASFQKTWTISCLIHGESPAIGRSQKRFLQVIGGPTRILQLIIFLAGQRP